MKDICTCARVGMNLHSVDCQQYTPGHQLASPELENQRLRAEWRNLRDVVAQQVAEYEGAALEAAARAARPERGDR